MPTTIAVAMSGGVDSSVAAALLVQQGYRVIGLTMHLWDFAGAGVKAEDTRGCCSPAAMNDARHVCHTLNIPHYVIDLRKDFEKGVIQNFVNEYLAGHTPNPCIRCNTIIKWEYLLRKARSLGADYLATGHYARVEFDGGKGRFVLKKGRDREKDQSYALWGLDQEKLKRTLFPLGSLTKSEVRRKAVSLGLKTAHKAESQEICFIPVNDYGGFLQTRLPHLHQTLGPGEIIGEDGARLGDHRGYPFYTIGQRKGLGIAVGRPQYVWKIDPQQNKIFVGSKEKLDHKELIAHQLNWVSIAGLDGSALVAKAKIRYNDSETRCTLKPQNGEILVRFDEPKQAVTPGQSVVFYDGDRVLGGGIIL